RHDHRTGRQLAVPEVRHFDRVLHDRGLRRRRVLGRLVGRGLFGDQVDVVAAGGHGERSRNPHRRLAGGDRYEGDVFVRVVGLSVLVVILLVLLRVRGRRGRGRRGGVLVDDAPVERHVVPAQLRRI